MSSWSRPPLHAVTSRTTVHQLLRPVEGVPGQPAHRVVEDPVPVAGLRHAVRGQQQGRPGREREGVGLGVVRAGQPRAQRGAGRTADQRRHAPVRHQVRRQVPPAEQDDPVTAGRDLPEQRGGELLAESLPLLAFGPLRRRVQPPRQCVQVGSVMGVLAESPDHGGHRGDRGQPEIGRAHV